jgi:N-acetylglucosamine-6-phosphate deacetylase
MLVLSNAHLVTPSRIVQHGWLAVDGDRIAALGEGPPPAADHVDLQGGWIVPGYVDLHVHGGGGHAFNSADPSALVAAADFHRGHGTTSLLTGIVTTTPTATRAALDAVEVARHHVVPTAARILGAYLEGPFISALRPGCHVPTLLRTPDVTPLTQYWPAHHDGLVRMVTFAPELSSAGQLCREIVDRGAVAAIGHSDADFDTALQAFGWGSSVVTHLFNAMSGIHHRAPGIVGAAFCESATVAELIVDGVHVHDETVRMAFQLAPGRIALVSDAVAGAGTPPGSRSRVGEADVVVGTDAVTLADGNTLAGSVLTLDRAVRRCIRIGISVLDAVNAATLVPAIVLGLTGELGCLVPGRLADLCLLGGSFAVRGVASGEDQARAVFGGREPRSTTARGVA